MFNHRRKTLNLRDKTEKSIFVQQKITMRWSAFLRILPQFVMANDPSAGKTFFKHVNFRKILSLKLEKPKKVDDIDKWSTPNGQLTKLPELDQLVQDITETRWVGCLLSFLSNPTYHLMGS